MGPLYVLIGASVMVRSWMGATFRPSAISQDASRRACPSGRVDRTLRVKEILPVGASTTVIEASPTVEVAPFAHVMSTCLSLALVMFMPVVSTSGRSSVKYLVGMGVS